MNERIASLIDRLREARTIARAAEMDRDDAAHRVEQARMHYSGAEKACREAAEAQREANADLAEAWSQYVTDMTSPYLDSEIADDTADNMGRME